MKGLIINEPWISRILAGSKVWEMRSQRTAKRGWIALVRKGSGTVVGVANLIGCIGPLSPEQLVAHANNHQIPVADLQSGRVAKWNVAWQLQGARRLSSPVPYRHRPGAVVWVAFDEDVERAIARQVGSSV